MTFDLPSALRAIKPQRRTRPLERRPDSALTWVTDAPVIGSPLLLDTSVYIDVLQGRTPAAVDRLLTHRTCHHSAVCLSELTHAFGRLDPSHGATASVLRILRETITDIPSHRLHEPDVDMWGRAGILAGLLVRLSGLAPGSGQEHKLLNDALVYLQARQTGCTVLTANIQDFDFLNQIIPSGRAILYRCERVRTR